MTQVIIYTTPTCVYCRAAKQFFADHQVVYSEVNATDPKIAQEIVTKTGQMSVPVIIINKDGQEEVVIGFDKTRLVKLLELV